MYLILYCIYHVFIEQMYLCLLQFMLKIIQMYLFSL